MGKPIYNADLKAKNDFELPQKAKEFSNYAFCHYTSIDKMDGILLSRQLWAGSVDKMNDLNERSYNSSDVRIYTLCFCNSDSEKIPMWYLYAGLTGQGMRLKLTPSVMLKFLHEIKEVYPMKDGKILDKALKIDEDIAMRYGWVYYKKNLKDSNGKQPIKYKNVFYDVIDYEPTEFLENNWFIKEYEWEYEKEFRIVFIDKKGANYDKVVVKIPDNVYEKLQIMQGPETGAELNLLKYKGFQKFLSSKIFKSTLSIQMNLLDRNRAELANALEQFIDKENATQFCQYIRQENYCNNRSE